MKQPEIFEDAVIEDNNEQDDGSYDENESYVLGMYSFFDIKGDRYDTPFFCANDLFAKRHYTIVTSEKGSMLNTFKNDFQLHRLGYFNLISGLLKQHPAEIIAGIENIIE